LFKYFKNSPGKPNTLKPATEMRERTQMIRNNMVLLNYTVDDQEGYPDGGVFFPDIEYILWKRKK
jgi:hypothetical protein